MGAALGDRSIGGRTPHAHWRRRRRSRVARSVGPRDEDRWSSHTPDSCDEGRGSIGGRPNRPSRRDALPHGHRFRRGSAQPVVSVARAERRAVAGRRPRQRRERRCHSTARGAASQFRRRRAPIGRATQEFAEPRSPAHGGHAAPARRRPGSVARARLNAGR